MNVTLCLFYHHQPCPVLDMFCSALPCTVLICSPLFCWVLFCVVCLVSPQLWHYKRRRIETLPESPAGLQMLELFAHGCHLTNVTKIARSLIAHTNLKDDVIEHVPFVQSGERGHEFGTSQIMICSQLLGSMVEWWGHCWTPKLQYFIEEMATANHVCFCAQCEIHVLVARANKW